MTETTSDRRFQPISPNPFIVGNPVRDPAMFFGREAEFSLVRRRFGQSERGCLMVFCGERRSGKTSILLQIQLGRLGSDFVPVLIDMQAMAVAGEIEFLARITAEIIKQLGEAGRDIAHPDFTRVSRPAAVFQEFIHSVLERHPNRKLVLLFDEYELFEDKIEGGALTTDVLLILSSLVENLPVFLVFTGSQHLEEQSKEYWRILHKAHEHRHISYLDPDDAVRLVREPVEGRVTYADNVIERIIRLTSGHAFYTQAICRNLVDAMNENRTVTATEEMLDAVVEHIVRHPFPQMTFQWKALERDHKLALALLAQTLEGDTDFATVNDLARTLKQGGYPLHFDDASIAASLEALFKQELLAKNDERVSGYAFRMNLWRRWVRRMHTVWQAMREEGLELRRRGIRRGRVTALGIAVIVLIVTVGLWIRGSGSEDPSRRPAPTASVAAPPASAAFVSLEPEPADASVYLDGMMVAVGPYRRAVAAELEHVFDVRAAGYLDSTVTVRLAEAESATVAVSLRPQRGSLRIEAKPPAARLYVDGEDVGAGEALRQDLLVPEAHVVEARLDGHHSETREIRILPDDTLAVSIELSLITLDFTVVTSPDGAEIFVDGARRGLSPLVVSDLSLGRHRFEARLTGLVDADTTLTIDDSVSHLRLDLSAEPPGVLVVRGDRPARIYIDERQIGSGELRSSGETRVASGLHTVEVVFRDGTSNEVTVTVLPEDTIELLWEQQKLRILEGRR